MFTSDNQRKDAIYRLLGLKRYMNSAGESEDKYLDMYGSVSVTPFGDTPDTIKQLFYGGLRLCKHLKDMQ